MKSILKKIYYQLPLIGTYKKLTLVGYMDCDITFWNYIKFRIFKNDKLIYWPKAKTCGVLHPHNITIGINSALFRSGSYVQGGGKIIIGNYVRMAVNVGIISANHNTTNHSEHKEGVVEIGDYCWVGMNSVILPNVTLGPRTVVAAGSVVTKSYSEGFCVIGGNPAKKIKDINPEEFVKPKAQYEFYGWIPKEKFEKFKNKHLRKNTIYFPKSK